MILVQVKEVVAQVLQGLQGSVCGGGMFSKGRLSGATQFQARFLRGLRLFTDLTDESQEAYGWKD